MSKCKHEQKYGPTPQYKRCKNCKEWIMESLGAYCEKCVGERLKLRYCGKSKKSNKPIKQNEISLRCRYVRLQQLNEINLDTVEIFNDKRDYSESSVWFFQNNWPDAPPFEDGLQFTLVIDKYRWESVDEN